MFAIRCLLLSSAAQHQELTYFSKEEMSEGSVIKITVRGKEQFGLVLSLAPIADIKQTLRTSAFSLKKLAAPQPRAVFSRPFLRACFEAAMHEACAPGALIAALAPVAILKKRAVLPEAQKELVTHEISYEPLLFTQAHAERVAEYRRITREALARGTSTLIITPTVVEAEYIAADLRHGIRGYVEVFHGSLSQKRQVESWKRAAESTKPVVIVGTLSALSIPRSDITTVIFEREGSQAYARQERPYINGKEVAERVAKQYGARFLLSATVPSVVSAGRRARGDVQDLGLSSVRMAGPVPHIIDGKVKAKETGRFEPLGRDATEVIETLTKEHKGVFVLAARKGLAPYTVCDDCGDILRCDRCGSTLTLHKREKNQFLCHHCGKEESATIRCRTCSGWRLTTLGIAIDRVREYLEKKFPDVPLYTFSGERTDAKADTKTILLWREKKGILLATERVLPYLSFQIDGIVVASVDSLLSVPEYTASERVFTLLAELRTRASERFLIQTREPSHRALRAVHEGMSASFFRDELRDRQAFLYPPFATLIRFTVSGKEAQVETQKKSLMAAVSHLSPIAIDARVGKRAEVRAHILLRLPEGAWVDARLLRFIRTLPPSVVVRVNPQAVVTD